MATLPTGDLTEEGPSYEVMYLLEAEDAAIATLRAELAPLGDSLVVVGGEGLWNVHIHVDDVGAAVEAGIRAGSPRRIEVTHFAEQKARMREKRAERRDASSWWSRPAGDWPSSSRVPGHRPSSAGRASARAPARSWRRSWPPAPTR